MTQRYTSIGQSLCLNVPSHPLLISSVSKMSSPQRLYTCILKAVICVPTATKKSLIPFAPGVKLFGTNKVAGSQKVSITMVSVLMQLGSFVTFTAYLPPCFTTMDRVESPPGYHR